MWLTDNIYDQRRLASRYFACSDCSITLQSYENSNHKHQYPYTRLRCHIEYIVWFYIKFIYDIIIILPTVIVLSLLLLEYLLNKCSAVEMSDVNEWKKGKEESGEFGVNPVTTYAELYTYRSVWLGHIMKGVV